MAESAENGKVEDVEEQEKVNEEEGEDDKQEKHEEEDDDPVSANAAYIMGILCT